jgi:hypothetical protein
MDVLARAVQFMIKEVMEKNAKDLELLEVKLKVPGVKYLTFAEVSDIMKKEKVYVGKDDLSGESELDLDDIYEISEDNVGTSHLHGSVLEAKHQLKINYQLMNIRTPNISDESKEDIIGSLNEEITPLNIGGFVMLYEADGLRNSIGNTHAWLAETFGSLILR